MVLPPLLYAASEELAWRDLRAIWRPVIVLVVGLMLASAVAVATAAAAAASPSVSMAFVLGAVLASTGYRRGAAGPMAARRAALAARTASVSAVMS